MIKKLFESTSDVRFVRIPGEKFGRLSHKSNIRIQNQYIDPSSVLQTHKQILQRTSLLVGHYLLKQWGVWAANRGHVQVRALSTRTVHSNESWHKTGWNKLAPRIKNPLTGVFNWYDMKLKVVRKLHQQAWRKARGRTENKLLRNRCWRDNLERWTD